MKGKRANRVDYILAIKAGYDTRFKLHRLFGYKTDNYNVLNALIMCGIVREITGGKVLGRRRLALRCRFTKKSGRPHMVGYAKL